MANLLTRKLEAFVSLSDADKRLLDDVARRPRLVGAREDLIREGEDPADVYLILEGFACRYKMLADGRRHIMAYLVPGDFGDLHVFILKAMDHSLATLSPCRVVALPRPRILEMFERPVLARALWWCSLVDEAVLREWLVNIGARTAEERVAHLLCELLLRLRTVGLADGTTYELPITQAEIADTMGLSHVHVNRVLQRLRREKLISLKSGSLVILDLARLKTFAGFNPNYLHLGERNGSHEAWH
jgi:CRP-like cAMP-binding protein